MHGQVEQNPRNSVDLESVDVGLQAAWATVSGEVVTVLTAKVSTRHLLAGSQGVAQKGQRRTR